VETNNLLDRDASLQKRKFLICAPSYSQNNGGAIVLHKLCHLINGLGNDAYLFPIVENQELNKFNYKLVLIKFLKKHLREPFRRFKTIPNLKTPVLKKLPTDIHTDNWVVIYPEITFGNPLRALNVVRWLLHNPDFNQETGKDDKNFFFGKGELYFRIGPWFKEFTYPGSTTSTSFLQVFHFPLHLFNLEGIAKVRTGTAYTIRKGKNKKITHDLTNSVLIDGLKHEEIARIFKQVKTFISYDSVTTYSHFATLCGCDSVIIPDEGVSEEDWMPNHEDRYGLAYGFENLPKAQETKHLLLEKFNKFEIASKDSVKKFLIEVNAFFSKNNA
jgi:hypothetical protein